MTKQIVGTGRVQKAAERRLLALSALFAVLLSVIVPVNAVADPVTPIGEGSMRKNPIIAMLIISGVTLLGESAKAKADYYWARGWKKVSIPALTADEQAEFDAEIARAKIECPKMWDAAYNEGRLIEVANMIYMQKDGTVMSGKQSAAVLRSLRNRNRFIARCEHIPVESTDFCRESFAHDTKPIKSPSILDCFRARHQFIGMFSAQYCAGNADDSETRALCETVSMKLSEPLTGFASSGGRIRDLGPSGTDQ